MSLLGEKLMLVDLYPTKLKKLDDPFELARETLTQIEGGPQMFDAAFEVRREGRREEDAGRRGPRRSSTA